MSFKCFISNAYFQRFKYEPKTICIFKTTTMKMAGNFELRMSLAGVKYGKYAHLVPDGVTYEFYECFSFQ